MKGLLCALLLAAPAPRAEALPAAAELSIHDLIDKANKALRGDSSHGRLT